MEKSFFIPFHTMPWLRQERHSDKTNGQIVLVRCSWETMVQFMEAVKSAIATAGPLALCHLLNHFLVIALRL